MSVIEVLDLVDHHAVVVTGTIYYRTVCTIVIA